ncbi:hypothetical protein BN871_AE_00010 [Paenibacillus sp. P22]|nr:hypothetical protein BN871_AE_00010 [Paenibacillus sp. P22]
MLLPQPLLPTTATNSPDLTDRFSSDRTGLPSNDIPSRRSSKPIPFFSAWANPAASLTGNIGRVPLQEPFFKPLSEAVGQLAEQGVDDDAEHNDVQLEKFPGVHGHVSDAGIRGDRLRNDEDEPGDAQGVSHADENGGQRARQDDVGVQGAPAHSVDFAHLDQPGIDRADAVERIEIDREKDAERYERKLDLLADAEPDDEQGEEGEQRDVADHLDRGVRRLLRGLGQSVHQSEGEADSAADEEAEHGPHRADAEIVQKHAAADRIRQRFRHAQRLREGALRNPAR